MSQKSNENEDGQKDKLKKRQFLWIELERDFEDSSEKQFLRKKIKIENSFQKDNEDKDGQEDEIKKVQLLCKKLEERDFEDSSEKQSLGEVIKIKNMPQKDNEDQDGQEGEIKKIQLLWKKLEERGFEEDSSDRERFKKNLVKAKLEDYVTYLDSESFDASDKDTSLFVATLKGYGSLVDMLLKFGAGVDFGVGKKGITSLHAACIIGHTSILKSLLSAKCVNVNIRDKTGKTPLHFASKMNNVLIVNMLLEESEGIDLDVTDYQGGHTPLMVASYSGFHHVVGLLLKKGALGDKQNIVSGYSALHYACINNNSNNLAVINCLLQQGVDVNMLGHSKNTALHLACKSCDGNVIQVLVDNGANVRAKNSWGQTPLHFTINWCRSSEQVDQLLAIGAFMEVQDYKGNTALHLAVELGLQRQIGVLLERGFISMLYLKNRDGKTPYDIKSDTSRALIAHIIKCQLARLYIVETNFPKDAVHDYRDLLIRVKKELENIRSFKVAENFFLSEVFTRQNKPFYLKNNVVVLKLTELMNYPRLKIMFPLYYYILRFVFFQARNRNFLILEASQLNVWSIRNTYLVDLVVHMILEYLSTQDLQNLIKSVKNS